MAIEAGGGAQQELPGQVPDQGVQRGGQKKRFEAKVAGGRPGRSARRTSAPMHVLGAGPCRERVCEGRGRYECSWSAGEAWEGEGVKPRFPGHPLHLEGRARVR